MNITYTKFWS